MLFPIQILKTQLFNTLINDCKINWINDNSASHALSVKQVHINILYIYICKSDPYIYYNCDGLCYIQVGATACKMLVNAARAESIDNNLSGYKV